MNKNILNKSCATMEEFCDLPIKDRFQLFIDFVGAQPPNKQYDYCDIYNCSLAQFGKSLEFYKTNRILNKYSVSCGGTFIRYRYDTDIEKNKSVLIHVVPDCCATLLLPDYCETSYQFSSNSKTNCFGKLYKRLMTRTLRLSISYYFKKIFSCHV